MHFIKYGIVIVCFEFLFWYLIFMIVSLPSMAFVQFLTWATDGDRTKTKRILLTPILIGGFLFGNLVPSLFFSAGIFVITNYFMMDASHPMVYAIVGGLLCFLSIAPSGEANLMGMLISVLSYILYMTILKTYVLKVLINIFLVR